MKLQDLFEAQDAQAKFDAVVYHKNTLFYHESPAPWREFYKHGITDLSTFCTVNQPSNFVTGDKTIICFMLPKGAHVHPDMRYDDVEQLVQEHPQIKGADVSVNQPIPLKYIITIEEVTERGKLTQYSID